MHDPSGGGGGGGGGTGTATFRCYFVPPSMRNLRGLASPHIPMNFEAFSIIFNHFQSFFVTFSHFHLI